MNVVHGGPIDVGGSFRYSSAKMTLSSLKFLEGDGQHDCEEDVKQQRGLHVSLP